MLTAKCITLLLLIWKTIINYYEIPRSKVQFTKLPFTVVTVAVCTVLIVVTRLLFVL